MVDIATNLAVEGDAIYDGNTGTIAFTILDDQVPAQGFKPTTLTLTIRDEESRSVVNSKLNTSIIANCTTGGVVTYPVEIADVTLLSTANKKVEGVHRFIFTYTWATASRKKTIIGRVEIKRVD